MADENIDPAPDAAPDTAETQATAPLEPAAVSSSRKRKKEETPVATATEETKDVTYEPPNVKESDVTPRKTWSTYGNQEAASVGAALAESEKNRSLQAETDAPFYTFMGHRDRHNGTEILKTGYGAVKIDGNIKLPDEELNRLRSLGFLFKRVK
jgi:hypothetical protein